MSVIIRGALAGGGGNKVKSIQRGTTRLQMKLIKKDINVSGQNKFIILATTVPISEIDPNKSIIILNGQFFKCDSNDEYSRGVFRDVILKDINSTSFTIDVSSNAFKEIITNESYQKNTIYNCTASTEFNLNQIVENIGEISWQVIEFD